MKTITNLHQNFQNADAATRNILAKQMEALVVKIVAQQSKKLHAPWDMLKSMAYEGLTYAMNTYDPEKSKQNFLQYAGFMILHYIRNQSYEELNTVKVTQYMSEQVKAEGGTTFVSQSISTIMNPDSDETSSNREMRFNVYESAKFANGNVMDLVVDEITRHCNPTDVKFFLHYFGIVEEELQNKEIAERYGVTMGRVSQRVKNVIKFIQKNEDLKEALASLLEH